jgi:hypothetical protein
MVDPRDLLGLGVMPPGRLGSRLTNGLSSLIVTALIVVDRTKVTGRAIGPIADYLAVLALSQARAPDRCGELPSIIDLLSADCSGREPPTALTAGDLAFLRGLYAADLEQPVVLERSDIQTKMLSEFGVR